MNVFFYFLFIFFLILVPEIMNKETVQNIFRIVYVLHRTVNAFFIIMNAF